MAPAQHAPAPAKKGKGKKATDPSEQQKQIQAKIAQLEQDAAGDKEQELEIGGFDPLDLWRRQRWHAVWSRTHLQLECVVPGAPRI